MSAESLDERILDAAKHLIIRFGYDKTTLDEVAETAGIARSTLYKRWPKKDKLFTALLWREMRRFLVVWLARIEADPAGGTFAGMFRHTLLAIEADPFMTALLRGERYILGALMQTHSLTSLYTQRYAMNQYFLGRMQAVGLIRPDVDLHAAAYVANVMNYGLLKMAEIIPEEHAPSRASVLTMVTLMLERSIGASDGGDSEAGKQVIRDYVDLARQQITALEQMALP